MVPFYIPCYRLIKNSDALEFFYVHHFTHCHVPTSVMCCEPSRRECFIYLVIGIGRSANSDHVIDASYVLRHASVDKAAPPVPLRLGIRRRLCVLRMRKMKRPANLLEDGGPFASPSKAETQVCLNRRRRPARRRRPSLVPSFDQPLRRRRSRR